MAVGQIYWHIKCLQTATDHFKTAHSVQHTEHITQHTAQHTEHTTHSTHHTEHSIQNTPHSTHHIAHSMQNTLHTAHTTHSTHDTPHTTHHTNSKSCCPVIPPYLLFINTFVLVHPALPTPLDTCIQKCGPQASPQRTVWPSCGLKLVSPAVLPCVASGLEGTQRHFVMLCTVLPVGNERLM